MKFVARLNFSIEVPRIRSYVHEAGISEAYGSKDPVLEARNHLLEILERNREKLRVFNYVLAAIWGDNGTKFIDFFGYNGINRWPGNPDVSAFVSRNGIYVPQTQTTCGDTLIVLGEEEKHRRTRSSLDDYMNNPPYIPNLNNGKPIITIDN